MMEKLRVSEAEAEAEVRPKIPRIKVNFIVFIDCWRVFLKIKKNKDYKKNAIE